LTRARRPSAQTLTVLDALARAPEDWRYGYELCVEVGLQAGTMYPILMRLADRGLLETGWETDPPAGRPPRHLYRLSADGRVFAAEQAADPVAQESGPVRKNPSPRPAPGGPRPTAA
jgi:DNA-binding PadR family transcriptional regulator